MFIYHVLFTIYSIPYTIYHVYVVLGPPPLKDSSNAGLAPADQENPASRAACVAGLGVL